MKKYMLIENAMKRPTRRAIRAALSRIDLDNIRRPTLFPFSASYVLKVQSISVIYLLTVHAKT